MEIPIQDVLRIIKETRAISLPKFGNVVIEKYKSAAAKDAVTAVDTEIELFLKNKLAILLPEISFVGEEYGGDRTDEMFWLVDPVDATGHYIRGIPFCTTMVALIDKGQVVFGAIYDFVNDDMYHAELDNGSYMNEQKISVNNTPLDKAYLTCEINSKKEENKKLVADIRESANILHTLSAGYEFVLVATGKIEGRIVYDGFGKDYDFAAGSLLVSEAGGVVQNIGSNTYDYTNLNFIAANPKVHSALCESIETFTK